MKKFLSIWFVVFLNATTWAYLGPEPEVTKHDYKLSRRAFLMKYAQNDSVLYEAINFYFDKRASGINKTIAFPIGLVITTLTSSVFVTTNNEQTKNLSSYGMVFGGVTTLVGIPLGVKGIRLLKKFNRKNLYLAIQQIKSGQMSSQDFYNKIHQY